jgi:hypothetical protein
MSRGSAMKSVFERLRTDASLQDADYAPPFSDFNVDRQPRRGDERDGAAGDRADQIPLLGEARSIAGCTRGA